MVVSLFVYKGRSALTSIRSALANRLLAWSAQLQRRVQAGPSPRRAARVLILFHGDSLAHTIRPLLIARALKQRGCTVELAGRGRHAGRLLAEGYPIHDVETMPQTRMDDYVARGDYAYYDLDWIDRCVRAERELVRRLSPDLLVADMRPTLPLTAALEGVDLAMVEAAYNQPGYLYPISLPQSFTSVPGPFEEYQQRHLGQDAKPHSILSLMADIPEFHPPSPFLPGYWIYVGPLIDTDLPEPACIPELTNGWDTNLPLIYLNCGSTGAYPGFLPEMLSLLAKEPYRVLVTTAGRWDGPALSDNIRVVEFLPAAWVMRRASLFVGIGGIGSIYHALREGIPVIGAPEHLDQEYHLNRVQALGLGVKLDWAEFHVPQAVLQAIERVMGEHAAYRARCQDFSQHIQRWQGGDAAADALLSHLAAKSSGIRIPTEYRLPESTFLRQLSLSAPPGLDAGQLRRLLLRHLPHGLPYALDGTSLVFDQRDSWNWLYDHEPRFFEADYRSLEARRAAFFIRENGRVRARRQEQQWLVTYRLRLLTPSLAIGKPHRLFLPFPLPITQQPTVELIDCWPADLKTSLLVSAGFFYGYPFEPPQADTEWLEYGYRCRLTTMTFSLDGQQEREPLTPRERQRYTEVKPELQTDRTVGRFLDDLSLSSTMTDCDRSRAVYECLASTKRFSKTKERCQCLGCSTLEVLTHPGAHCITLATAFIALCRLQGIPARLVCGALAGYPVGDGRYELSTRNEPLFGHTWAQVYLQDYGWIPVEFHGIVIGAQAMTGDNVADPALRALITAQGPAYRDYYFGNLDCHRLFCSNAVRSIPQVVALPSNAEAQARAMPPVGLQYECALSFECA